jgi:wyosine [tRNA(Phe)-imidazoG37] synthetase (radical SAM superfamily)
VSVGINLNPNNACNWHCAYCQVPGLVRGAAPEIDLALLERELKRISRRADPWRFHGGACAARGPRVIRDIAFSGNGEPTGQRNVRPRSSSVWCAIRDEFGLGRRRCPSV